MPKYFCDYCDTYLTHDSPSVRKTHCAGRKHRENVKFYYEKWYEQNIQKINQYRPMIPPPTALPTLDFPPPPMPGLLSAPPPMPSLANVMLPPPVMLPSQQIPIPTNMMFNTPPTLLPPPNAMTTMLPPDMATTLLPPPSLKRDYPTN